MKGSYVKNRKQSIYEYLRSTAIMNPHADITLIEPDGGHTDFERVTEKLPLIPKEIKPHPYGIELGTFMKMAKEAKERKIISFLSNSFSSVSLHKAKMIIEKAGLNVSLNPSKLSLDDAKNIVNAFKKVRLMAPPTDCLSPLGELLIKRGLKKETQTLSPEFISTDKRNPTVFSGTPFMVETGIVYGGNLPKEERIEILRFANRVPLLYQEGSCVITESLKQIDWRRYGLQQRGGRGIPYGPAIILVHVASVNIPFTSESKEAIAHVEEIEKEIRLSLQQCARKMKSHLAKKEKKVKTKNKFVLISKILPEIAKKSAETLGKSIPPIDEIITQIMDIIWIDDSVKFVENKTISEINVVNYKKGAQSFVLYAALPIDGLLGKQQPSPEKVDEKYIKWKVDLKPSEKKCFSFELLGTEKDDFDENSLYVSNINPLYVIGAEKWEGE
jgi:DNA topoisomerase-6 subunit B